MNYQSILEYIRNALFITALPRLDSLVSAFFFFIIIGPKASSSLRLSESNDLMSEAKKGWHVRSSTTQGQAVEGFLEQFYHIKCRGLGRGQNETNETL